MAKACQHNQGFITPRHRQDNHDTDHADHPDVPVLSAAHILQLAAVLVSLSVRSTHLMIKHVFHHNHTSCVTITNEEIFLHILLEHRVH